MDKLKQKSLFREALEIILVIVIAYAFYFGLGLALGTPTPMFSVVSESMEPTLHVGDLVIIKSDNNYNEGDIVVYMRGSTPIIHRIIQERSDGFIIKGDNNKIADSGVVRKEQIVGKTIFAFPILGFPRLALFKLGL